MAISSRQSLVGYLPEGTSVFDAGTIHLPEVVEAAKRNFAALEKEASSADKQKAKEAADAARRARESLKLQREAQKRAEDLQKKQLEISEKRLALETQRVEDERARLDKVKADQEAADEAAKLKSELSGKRRLALVKTDQLPGGTLSGAKTSRSKLLGN